MAARTIDLCNNPQTKEAKLDRARRLLPEWTAYDEQTRMLFDEWKRGEGVTTLTRSSTVMPSVSVTVTTETAESSTLPAHDEL